MAGRSGRGTGRLLAAAVAVWLGAGPAAEARDLSGLSAEEVRLLQERLTQAGCYAGPRDGRAGDALATAKAACPDQDPVLRIETGMHVATINRIGADPQCRLLATASDDKTVRLWDMPGGRLRRTQRLPIGPGDAGKVYAVAVSPDAGLVAAGGWLAGDDKPESVTLFDAGRGESVRRIGAFEDVINHLAFSPDGTRLAVALGGGEGVRVLEVASGREVMADRDFGGRDSYGVGFGPDGSLYAVGDDGMLRRYAGPNLARSAKVATRGGKQPYSVAADPTGRRLALGYEDSPAVDLYDAASLRPIAQADTAGVGNGNLGSVAWSRDGRRLVAGGTYSVSQGGRWPSAIHIFTPEGQRVGADVPVADSTIQSLEPCGTDLAYGASDPSFGVLSPDGTARGLGQGRTVDMRDKRGEAFTVSADGTRLRFGLGVGGDMPVLFDLARATLTEAPGALAGLRPPMTEGLPVRGWQDTTAPKLGGKRLALDQYERSQALAVRADRTGFVLGADWSLRAFEAGGRERWQVPVPGTAWGVTLARGGALVVAAYGDGTLRWQRGSDGREVLALFVDKPTRRWVAWTPSGYYMASAGGE